MCQKKKRPTDSSIGEIEKWFLQTNDTWKFSLPVYILNNLTWKFSRS